MATVFHGLMHTDLPSQEIILFSPIFPLLHLFLLGNYLIQNFFIQVYDMRFELNEIEARREQYPSTISFINLLNTLIATEKDVSDRGHRYWTFCDCTYYIMVFS